MFRDFVKVCEKFVVGSKFVAEKMFGKQHPLCILGTIFSPRGVFDMFLAAHKKIMRNTVSEFLWLKATVFFRSPSHSRIFDTINPPSELEFAIAVCGKV